MSLPGRGAPGLARSGPEANPEPPGVFLHAVAEFEAGREQQMALRPELVFETLPAPRRLAAHAAALAVTVQAARAAQAVRAVDAENLEDAGAEIASGEFILLYQPEGRPGWAGPFRLVAQIRADLDPEIAADPLLGSVGWSWLTEALDARTVGYAAPSGTVTRVVTEGFGAKQGEREATEFELRASWSPAAPGRGTGAPELAGHVAAWCDAICAAAGLPPAGPGVIALRPGTGPASGRNTFPGSVR